MQKPPFGGFAPRAAATGVVCHKHSGRADRGQYRIQFIENHYARYYTPFTPIATSERTEGSVSRSTRNHPLLRLVLSEAEAESNGFLRSLAGLARSE